ncbi:MAG: penicillin-binding protein 1A [Gammaproteobacteria bacterium]|nr:penicillin-binding protein 1A [Gammaproteobacteria bacterium]MCP5200757.1 penicillin-binding protein 1A [Gammaproteobacteria bacterium]
MLRIAFYSLLLAGLLGVLGVAGIVWYIVPQLPPVEALREVHLQTPLRVFSRDGRLIAEFGEKRRNPVAIEDVPLVMKQAFLAAEDDRFYYHPGVDWMAIARAMVELVQTREKRQGGSTITMQVARNFFLTPEKTYERKLKEIVLAVVIERELTKDEILELYLNKIFLGHRAYGVGAAAQVYYGRPLGELDLAEVAMIAGLPKAPSRTNPISNPGAAMERRNYVLARMLKLGFIEPADYEVALAAPNTAEWHGQAVEVPAPHVAEMVRDRLLDEYGEIAYTAGYRVTTTVDSRLQDAAEQAVRAALIGYDHRHGYRGVEAHFEPGEIADDGARRAALAAHPMLGGLAAALVVAVGEQSATVWTRDQGELELPWDGLKWARKRLGTDAVGAAPKTAADVVAVGDVVRIRFREPPAADAAEPAPGYWQLEQLPAVEGALVSLDPHDGAIRALVGGFDYDRSKFNRVLQARRQPGSNFKPFIYSAALEKGFTAASFINDAPIVFDEPGLESAWRPENYSGQYYGPTRLREALINSRNLVSIRLLRAIGVDYALEYVARFGFHPDELPRNLSMALGSGEVTPLQLVSGYAVLANGGYRVEPYFIQRIEDGDGEPLFEASPATVCTVCEQVELDDDGEPSDLETLVSMQHLPPQNPAPRVIAAENAWIMNSMMQDVIKFGTGRRARSLGRQDLAGKTGTTNDQKDAWFSGFNANVVTTVWVGFDRVAPLGRRETGAQAALPMWIDFMKVALDGMPEATMERPPGLVTVRIDPDTGLLAGANNPNAIFESFREGHVPPRGDSGSAAMGGSGSDRQGSVMPEQLF